MPGDGLRGRSSSWVAASVARRLVGPVGGCCVASAGSALRRRSAGCVPLRVAGSGVRRSRAAARVARLGVRPAAAGWRGSACVGGCVGRAARPASAAARLRASAWSRRSGRRSAARLRSAAAVASVRRLRTAPRGARTAAPGRLGRDALVRVRGAAAAGAAPIAVPQLAQKRASLPYSSPQTAQVPPTPGWNTTALAARRGERRLERVRLGVEAGDPLDLRADDGRVGLDVPAAGAVDLVEQPAEVAQHQLARAAQVAEPAAQPAAAPGGRAQRRVGGVDAGRHARVGEQDGGRLGVRARSCRPRRPAARRAPARAASPDARPGGGRSVWTGVVAGVSAVGAAPSVAAAWPSGRGLAGVGGARALDASQESAHGRSGARSPMRSKRRV